jgi:hypothetical protein
MSNAILKGRITAQIEDKEGNVKQACTVENTITNAYLKRALWASLQSGAVALRSVSKPTTGQYSASADSGTFGIFALNRQITVAGDTVVPPYVKRNRTTIADDVTFYNVNNSLTETAKEMLAVDNRSVYRRRMDDNSFIVEYVKNSGVGSVQSIVFGRHYAEPQNVIGLMLGEAIYQPIWTTGTTEYFLEHILTGNPTELCPKGNQQETIVWKGVSSSSQFSANLVTKQVTTYAVSALYSNLTNTNLLGAHIFTTSVGKKVAIKATGASYSGADYTVTFYYNLDTTAVTTTASRTITFQSEIEDETFNVAFYPIMVSRPDLGDNGKLELFVTTSYGTYTIDDVPVTGCSVYKLTIENPTDPANSDVVVESMGVFPYGIGQYGNVAVAYYLSGFYFANLQNDDAGKTDNETPEGVYYLPYILYNDETGMSNLNTTAYAMGIIVDDEFTTVAGEYLARTSTSAQINMPVFTDSGVLFCRVNSTTLYYVTLSGVISGANLPQTLTKGENDILRLIYEYSLT